MKLKRTKKEITVKENKAEKLQDDAKEMEEVDLPKVKRRPLSRRCGMGIC